eukprot:9257883-Alexandrium_andersonii.AAC.1
MSQHVECHWPLSVDQSRPGQVVQQRRWDRVSCCFNSSAYEAQTFAHELRLVQNFPGTSARSVRRHRHKTSSQDKGGSRFLLSRIADGKEREGRRTS